MLRPFRFFQRNKQEANNKAAANTASLKASNPARTVAPNSIPVYPPVDPGIAIVDIEELLVSQKDLLKRLRILAGGSEEHYKKFYEAIVRNLAAYIQLLPASKSETHQGAGGMFRLCLEVGVFSLQSAEKVVFADHESVEIRRELEPRWRYATFLAGIGSELYRPLSDMVVTNEKGESWPKHLKSISDWANEAGIDRYFVQWQKPEVLHTQTTGRADVALLLRSILPDYSLQYLENASPKIVPVVFAVASGATHPTDNIVAKLVSDTKKRITKQDMVLSQDYYGKLQVGNHLDPYFMDAMRTLYRNGTWKVNGSKSRMWYSHEGLFLIWKSAAKEIISSMNDSGVSGTPKDITTLAEMMCEAGILVRNGKAPTWVIVTPESEDEWQAVKVAEPVSIFEDDQIDPVKLQVKQGQTVPQKPGSQSAPSVDTKASSPTETTPDSNSSAEKPRQITAKPKKTPEEEDKPAKPAPIDSQMDLAGMSETFEPAKDPDAEVEASTSAKVDPKEHEAASTDPVPNQSMPANQPKVNATDTQKQEKKSPRPPVADPDGDIAPPEEVTQYKDYVSEEAKKILKMDIQEVVGKMIDDYRRAKKPDSIFDVPEGIAFDNKTVMAYGMPLDRLIGLLHTNEWLEPPAGNPNAKTMKVQNPRGEKTTCIVIKKRSAQFLGFKGEA